MAVTVVIPSLLAELARAGIRLRLVGDGHLEVTAPQGGLSEELRGRIVGHKPELVTWLARNGTGSGRADELAVIVPDPAHLHEPFPPSDLQMSFLIGSREGFEHHVRPHQYMEFDFAELDPSRFEAALNRALHRQRANLVVLGDDMRLRTVRDPVPVRVRVSDLRGQSPAQARESIARVRAGMRRRELPLDRWPWMDVEISRYGQDRARLHYNNNNFFSDAFGTFRFLDTVMRYYRGPDAPTSELTVSFRDCVLALAELERSPLGQAAKRYWCDRMTDLPAAPQLPLVAGADTRKRSWLRRRELVFAADVWTAVKRRGAERGLTPSSTACAVYAEVIAYWSGSRHFLLNNMITHRLPLHPQMSEVMGNFAALYPLEVDWRHDESFGDRAHRLQAQVLADMENLHWSSVKVLQTLNQVRRAPARAACPVAVGSALFLGQVDRPVYSLLETPQVILDCELWEQRDGSLWVVWDVIEAMFPVGLVDAMHRGYRTMLTRLAEDDRAWEERAPDLLPTVEREQRVRLNRSRPPVPAGRLHECLPARAVELADKPAVVTDQETVSYAALHRRTVQIADLLRVHGIRPGDLVAVVLPKGWEQIVAVLGTLTTGGAYVPIDPEWPLTRIRCLLDDTGARAVLTRSTLRETIRAVTAVPVLTVDDGHPDLCPSTVVAAACRPEDLAYVIYTSGSTGRPKGAMLDHRGPLNTITDINRRFGIGADDVVFGLSSLSFDLSVYDIFGTLAAGATLLLPAARADPASWVEQVRGHPVTVVNCVPALMQLLVDTTIAAGVQFPALRVVLLSGDWIPVHLPAQIRALAPNAQVVSLGGATEASIWSICYPIGHHEPERVSIPYGKPLANQAWHVLDEAGRDCPNWTPGELYIGGTGVALGYLGDPARTEAAFVAHPRTGERLYRTGDLGRYLPSGDIELLGRADLQVKIQGYRVEPGEIEHALNAYPGVRGAAVVARPSSSGRQLSAFVVGTDGVGALDPSALREFLAGRLPGYLVPSTITVLDELPRTPNGKLDRRALRDRPPAGERAERGYTAPRTVTESTLADIWQVVLGNARIGVHDDFFELGGQSFAALRVVGLLSQRIGRQIPVGALLERRTVARLAEWLASLDEGWSPLVRLREMSGRDPWFLIHPAGGDVLCYRRLAELLDRGSYAFQAPGPATGRRPLDRVGDLAGTYLRALADVQPHGPYRLGGWSSGAVIALEMAHRLERRGERVERIVVIDAPAPLAPRPVEEADVLSWFIEDLDIGVDRGRLRAADLDAGDLTATLAVFRGVVRACGAYRAPRVAADITVLRAASGTVSEFAGHPSTGSPDWGWSALSTGTVTAIAVPGTHHTLLTDPGVTAVSEAISGRAPREGPAR